MNYVVREGKNRPLIRRLDCWRAILFRCIGAKVVESEYLDFIFASCEICIRACRSVAFEKPINLLAIYS